MSRHKGRNLRFQPAGGEKPVAIPVGKKQTLKIERLSHDGRGIAFCESKTWFVTGALVDEQVVARVLNARSKVVEANAEKIEQASPLRQVPKCQYFSQCGGCTLQHMSNAQQLSLKQKGLAEQLQRAGVEPKEWAPSLESTSWAYRRRARIAVKWDDKQGLQVGFRQAASNAIVAVEQCLVLQDDLQQVFPFIVQCLKALYKPRSIGHVEVFSGTHIALLVRLTAPLAEQDYVALRELAQQQNLQLWWQDQGLAYPDKAESTLGFSLPTWNLTLAWRPGDFVQVNDQINQQMIEQALTWLAPKKNEYVLDLFCGLGNFSLPLAKQVAQVVGVEGVPAMVERAKQNAQSNQLNNVQFYHADLNQPLVAHSWAKQKFAGALLDPPREGALETVKYLAKLAVERIVYVSCNPATLARDAAALEQCGYKMIRCAVMDMFPQTAHVEAMALFERT
ncbi:23S rRNA (uracil(1939)-C(5))-methyltransferase RlmD [Pseudomonas sp. F1_0610]|uniref:23S rRNA (uracil(1939)-C(5))-methyltransferase RlmD n=1 Tax=Pseudomonas sp. F1_0610 TaxID=3114284 RepID=UPI0039C07065